MGKNKGKILIIDDNVSILNSLKLFLKYEFGEIETIKNPNLIPSLIRAESFDIILLDMNFSAGVSTGNEGIFWLKKILDYDPSAVVIMITAYGDINLAVKAIKKGATDFITKPWDSEKLLSTLKTAYQLRQSKLEVKSLRNKQKILKEDIDKQFNHFIGSSQPVKEVLKTINKVAGTDANVLILGENGTGKELVARSIHRNSGRGSEIFMNVDLGALSETLFESELFGHIKGSFTDAKDDRTGRFETANGGTLFLDEIGNLSMSMQTKLLTVLQNKEIIPVGANKPVEIDIRLICATNKDLDKMVSENLFREDLLYRINTIMIEVPPLRERGNDITILSEYFLKQYSKKYEKFSLKISSKAVDKLLEYPWPGNVRELQHTVEKAVILSESDVLNPEDFPFRSAEKPKIEESESLNLEDVEKFAIQKAMKKNKGNLSYAAKELGISRTTLYSKLSKYGL